ncbi:MAG: carbohydrate binding family 9 domain-containing protein [Bacteroidetes bacterium]|nr:carbohydrate binding family 9 domain-containing protein [Bacteroidota bacterium]
MKYLFSIFLSLTGLVTQAQLRGLQIKRASGPIKIDGIMDEPDWQTADVADHFKQVFPFDSSFAIAPTEVRMTYDSRYIYLFAIMYNKVSQRKYVTTSLKRDYRGPSNDGFTLVLDTYKDKTNGFLFGINPFGVQREALLTNGGNDDLSLSWDNKWFSEARMLGDRWVCEMAIPFKTLRFKQNLSSWFINFYRIDSHHTEQSSWAPIPRVYPPTALAFNRELIWDKPLSSPGGNVSLIPYMAAHNINDFQNNMPVDRAPSIGGDAKVAMGPALNLDLTVNPDFSQVEVDQQVTNLSRFEIFYPEKRQFFLENADLFGSFGYGNMRPFFSRRIGVTRDPTIGQNIENRIYGGARLSGKIDNNWRIGLMTMQAAENNAIKLPSINYTVAAVQRKVFTRSNIGLMLINKQAFHDSTTKDFKILPNQYNRLVGIDFNLGSKDNKWNGKAFYHRSFDQTKKDSAFASTISLTYSKPKITFDILAQTVGANFNPEVGYLPRARFNRFAPDFFYAWYPKSKIINNHGPGMDTDIIGNDLFGVTDADYNIWYNINFQNTATFFMRVRQDYGLVFFPFDPTFPANSSLAKNLPFKSHYYWNSVILSYQSNARKRFFYSFQSRLGQYYNGHRVNVDGNFSYRLQPYAVLSVDYSVNHISLPSAYNSADLILISPKFDLTFSRKLFWTTYFQYNNQINNVNINSRLQWRFRPVSDLYIVYTDNYFAETNSHGDFLYLGQPKYRSLVIKLTYWLNL